MQGRYVIAKLEQTSISEAEKHKNKNYMNQ